MPSVDGNRDLLCEIISTNPNRWGKEHFKILPKVSY